MGIIIRRNLNVQENRRIRQDIKNIDLVHGTAAEQTDSDVGNYEFSGYHRSTIESYLSGVGGSSYSRQIDPATGQLRGCGINFYERLVQRHELLLRSTGEPIVLLRRKWTGERCPCHDKRRGQPRRRCGICYGTSYVGGYVRFINQKESDGRIFVRVTPAQEDLEAQEQGMFQKHVPSGCWTLPTPTLRDRDIIVRFDPVTGEESWRYEINGVTRNAALFNTQTAQMFNIFRLDKSHPIYLAGALSDFNVDLKNNFPGDLRGKGDELQDQIEKEFGDAYNDGGFSLGYMSGYDRGYHDSYYNAHLKGIPDDNLDGYCDIPFGQHDGYSDERHSGLEFWLDGYREGYRDGLEDGDKARIDAHPVERLDMETRRVDIPSKSLEHPDPRPPIDPDALVQAGQPAAPAHEPTLPDGTLASAPNTFVGEPPVLPCAGATQYPIKVHPRDGCSSGIDCGSTPK